MSDDELLDRFQFEAFRYFLDNANPATGLIADTNRPGSPCSIAVVGFALSCYPVGVERRWITRPEATAQRSTRMQASAAEDLELLRASTSAINARVASRSQSASAIAKLTPWRASE